MDLADIIRSRAVALNEHDSQAFSKWFSEKAIVYEQHKVHAGRKAITQWRKGYSQ